MAKTEADGLRKVGIAWLNKKGLLSGYHNTIITWTSHWGGENSVSVAISLHDMTDRYIIFTYTQTDRGGEKKDFDYKVPILTTPCHYGGHRYWFKCSVYRNGVYCGRRVGVLYKAGDYFACRHCYDLTYASRNVSGIQKRFGSIISAPEMDELAASIKRTHYRGQETKRYRSYLRKAERFERAIVGMGLALGIK